MYKVNKNNDNIEDVSNCSSDDQEVNNPPYVVVKEEDELLGEGYFIRTKSTPIILGPIETIARFDKYSPIKYWGTSGVSAVTTVSATTTTIAPTTTAVTATIDYTPIINNKADDTDTDNNLLLLIAQNTLDIKKQLAEQIASKADIEKNHKEVIEKMSAEHDDLIDSLKSLYQIIERNSVRNRAITSTSIIMTIFLIISLYTFLKESIVITLPVSVLLLFSSILFFFIALSLPKIKSLKSIINTNEHVK